MLRSIKPKQEKTKRLIDNFGRNISYLRLSLTCRCNYRCFYCRPSAGFSNVPREDILKYEEFYRLVRIAVKLGIKKVRLTGGEPLMRNGLMAFIPRLTSIPGLEDVSLTTNGAFLKKHLHEIYGAGIHRLNISMDTLRRDRYLKITGADCYDAVWEAIHLAEEMEFKPIKINMVAIQGVNDDELVEMAMLSTRKPYHIRFIEYMPIGVDCHEADTKIIPITRIKAQLEKVGKLIPIEKSSNDGPAVRYRFEGAPGEIGFIGSMTNHFCGTCNRLRLTADGMLRPCLLSNAQTDVKGPMRNGATDDELEAIFMHAVAGKPFQHMLADDHEGTVHGQMSMIGG